MNNLGIGKLISSHRSRDAIHMAVYPCIAAMGLKPGWHVGIDPNGCATHDGKRIGVVDPFLLGPVNAGQEFWLFLYPGSITSLRHEWSHPALADSVPSPIASMQESEIYLRAYGMRLSPYDDAQTAFQNLCDGLKRGEIFAHGSDLHGFGELEDSDALRRHAEAFLGIRVDWNNFEFSCSC